MNAGSVVSKILTVGVLACLSSTALAFTLRNTKNVRLGSVNLFSSPESIVTRNPSIAASEDWELDCYSRPVMVEGKKLWEVLITDSSGSFRLCETLPSNK